MEEGDGSKEQETEVVHAAAHKEFLFAEEEEDFSAIAASLQELSMFGPSVVSLRDNLFQQQGSTKKHGRKTASKDSVARADGKRSMSSMTYKVRGFPLQAPSIGGASEHEWFEMSPDVESLLDKLPVPVLHKIFFLLDTTRAVDEELLDATVMLHQEERKLSKDMMSLLRTCKRVYEAGMKRGGLPSARPLFFAVTYARRGDEALLRGLLETIGPGKVSALLNRALIEACTSATGERVVAAAQLLLDLGASPMCESFAGQPVHIAARRNHVALLELLMSRGTDPTVPDGVGFTAAQCAYNSGNSPLSEEIEAMWERHKKREAGVCD